MAEGACDEMDERLNFLRFVASLPGNGNTEILFRDDRFTRIHLIGTASCQGGRCLVGSVSEVLRGPAVPPANADPECGKQRELRRHSSSLQGAPLSGVLGGFFPRAEAGHADTLPDDGSHHKRTALLTVPPSMTMLSKPRDYSRPPQRPWPGRCPGFEPVAEHRRQTEPGTCCRHGPSP